MALQTIEMRAGLPVRAIRDGAGALLGEEALACGVGRVRGRVVDRCGGVVDAPIADLMVSSGGRLVTTDSRGRFDAHRRVLARAGAGPGPGA